MKIYNTITRNKEDFTPITPGKIKMYTCGQTTYNDIHMGNARFYVVFDAVRRYLEYCGYTVDFVQNFTDIDDKIIARAIEEGISTKEIAEKYIASTLTDLDALNVKRATINPRVTEEMPEIIEMIQQLIKSGHAYEKNGTVYYNVSAFPQYGKLSKKNIDELESGARVEVEGEKNNPIDFVLWKPAKPGEPQWESPWGNGRPGWHIECSATARKYLGDEIDIHGGGADLIFPHHENEIAQTEALTGKNFARTWMHCGVLTVDHKKMSKSRNNFATLQEVAEKFPHDVLRFFFLSGHYRMPMEFTETVLNAAQQGLTRIRICYNNITHSMETAINAPAGLQKQNLEEYIDRVLPTLDVNSDEANLLTVTAEFELAQRGYHQDFLESMNDDFNTADAITAIFELVRHINVFLARELKPYKEFLLDARNSLTKYMDIFGIKADKPHDETLDVQFTEKVEALIAARQAARKDKDFAESDRIRDQLTAMGITLEDTREGIRWHRA